MRKSSLGLMAAAALAGAAVPAGSAAPAESVKAPAPTAPQQRKRREALPEVGHPTLLYQRPRGPGWTVAQVKRRARKLRNQIKNRRACR